MTLTCLIISLYCVIRFVLLFRCHIILAMICMLAHLSFQLFRLEYKLAFCSTIFSRKYGCLQLFFFYFILPANGSQSNLIQSNFLRNKTIHTKRKVQTNHQTLILDKNRIDKKICYAIYGSFIHLSHSP